MRVGRTIKEELMVVFAGRIFASTANRDKVFHCFGEFSGQVSKFFDRIIEMSAFLIHSKACLFYFEMIRLEIKKYVNFVT